MNILSNLGPFHPAIPIPLRLRRVTRTMPIVSGYSLFVVIASFQSAFDDNLNRDL